MTSFLGLRKKRSKGSLSDKNTRSQAKQYNQQNPYSQPSGGYGQSAYGQSSYGQSSYSQSSGPPSYGRSRNPYAQQQHPQQQGMEMSQYPAQGGAYSSPYADPSAPSQSDPNQQDPHFIINECRSISDATQTLKSDLTSLQTLQTRSLSDPNNSTSKNQLESQNAQITTTYKSLINRLKFLKSRPQSNAPINASQIGLAERNLRDAWQRFQELEAQHRRKLREQIERQYRITRPEATDDEVRAATQDQDVQIFSQALMNSNRRGEARTVLSSVQQRHNDIQKIERQMTELAELFQQMAETVAVQEPLVQGIEERAVETHENLEQGNVHMEKAVGSARAARKKKWICLGLTILIILIIIIVLLIVLKVLKVY